MTTRKHPHEPESDQTDPNVALYQGKIAELESDLAESKDRYLRLAADFDNFRKRTTQETERRVAAQKEAFIRELLPVIDNLERALGSDVSTSPEQLREGVQMTLQQLNQLLRRHGIEPEEASHSTPVITRLSPCASTRLNPTVSCLRPSSAVTAAATKSFARPKWSSTI
jgi:molecular chaperone GrpE (heat shock protein)